MKNMRVLIIEDEAKIADATYSNIDFNGYKLYVNGVAINQNRRQQNAVFFVLNFIEKDRKV